MTNKTKSARKHVKIERQARSFASEEGRTPAAAPAPDSAA